MVRWKPESASTWLTPEREYFSFISLDNLALCPEVMDSMIAAASPSIPAFAYAAIALFCNSRMRASKFLSAGSAGVTVYPFRGT